MSNAALNWVFPMPLKGPRKSVLLALAEHANGDGVCWPSIARLALYAGVCERAVRDAIIFYEKAGLVTLNPSHGRKTNQYKLQLNTACPAGVKATGRTDEASEATGNHAPHAGLEDEQQEPNPAPHSIEPCTTFPNPAPHSTNPAPDAPEPLEPKKNQELTLIDIPRGVNVIQLPNTKAAKAPKNKARTAIDPAWQPSEVDIAFADSRGVDPFAQVELFVANHEARGTLMASWPAAWRTWVLNSPRFNSQRPGGRVDPKEGRRAAYANPRFGTGF